MILSKHSIAIIEANSKGYSMDNCGAINLNGQKVVISESANGYKMFSFKSEVVGWQRISVSKFIAFKKFGEIALGENIEARHINGDRYDNRPENIGMGRPSDNAMDIPVEKRINRSINAADRLRKLTYQIADELIKDHKKGLSLRNLSKKYKISKTGASYIINGKTYSNRR